MYGVGEEQRHGLAHTVVRDMAPNRDALERVHGVLHNDLVGNHYRKALMFGYSGSCVY